MGDCPVNIVICFFQCLEIPGVMLGKQVKRPKILTWERCFCPIDILVWLFQTFFCCQENLFNDILEISSFVKNLNFSKQTNEIFLKVWLNELDELFSKLLSIFDGRNFINFSNFGFKFSIYFLIELSGRQVTNFYILFHVFNILRVLFDEELQGGDSIFFFSQFEAVLIYKFMPNIFIQNFILVLVELF